MKKFIFSASSVAAKMNMLCLFVLCAASTLAATAPLAIDTKTKALVAADGSTTIDAKSINLTLGGFTISDASGAKTIVLGSVSGTKLGATGDRIGFLGAAPVLRQNGNLFTALTNFGLISSPSLTIGNITGLQTELDAKATTAALNDFLADIDADISAKADQTALDSLTTSVAGKASQAALDTLTTTVGTKAAQSALDSLTTVVGTKATQTALDSLTTTVAAKAADSAVVHNTGPETIAGVKTFSSAPVVPAGAFPQAAVANLTADLGTLTTAVAVKAADNAVVHLTGTESIAGDKTFTGNVSIPSPITFGVETANVTNLKALAAPGAPTVIPFGASGSTAYTYRIVAKAGDGTTTNAGAATSIANGNATLSGSNYNTLTWTPVTGAASYDVYRTASSGTPASTGKIATVTAPAYNDQAAVGDSSSPPGFNSTGNLVYRDGTGTVNPTRTIYLSKAGAKLDSNIDTGGGTDDTAVIQAVLDQAQAAGVNRLEVIVDGVARVNSTGTGSCLTIHSNTTLRFMPGAGFFLSPNTTASYMLTTDLVTGAYANKNIEIIGGVFNGNGQNQDNPDDHSKDTEPGYNFASKALLWFNRFENVTLRDVTIRNSMVYASQFVEGKKLRTYNTKFHWDDGDAGYLIAMNHDGFHLLGPLDDWQLYDTESNGDDDVIAINTNEHMGDGDSRRANSPANGAITNGLVDGLWLHEGSPSIRLFGVGATPGYADNITFRRVYGHVIGNRPTWYSSGATFGRISVQNYTLTSNSESADIVLSNGDSLRLDAIAGTVGANLSNITRVEGTSSKLLGTSTVRAIAYRTTNQTLPNATSTALTFPAELVDSDNFHATTGDTSKLVFPYNGTYLVKAQVAFASNSTGLRTVSIRKNGGVIVAADNKTAITGDETIFSVSILVDVIASEFVQVYAYQNSGSNLDVAASDYSMKVEVVRLP